MLKAFKNQIHQLPSLIEHKFLLAISGGVDSVVLAHLCKASNLNFSLAHCNFNLRDVDSDTDEIFVRELAKTLNVGIHVKNFKTVDYVSKNKVSIQLGARELRYSWFAELQKEFGYKQTVTAHHADDNLETFIINLSRGTGLDGLTGIPENTSNLARPLLPFTRTEIETYALSKNLSWREDKSNADSKYLRNKIRHELVPTLKALHPTFDANFKQTLAHLNGTSALVQNHINQLKKELFVVDGNDIRIAIDALNALQPINTYIYELFKDYNFTAWNDIAQLLTAVSGKIIHSKTHRLIKDRTHLILTNQFPDKPKKYFIEENVLSVTNPITLRLSTVTDFATTDDRNKIYIAKNTLKFPLEIRKWQEGDYFYPLGMKGKKKVSKYFKDEKMDALAKERQWLLCSDNEIVWIIGKRPDNRFKVTDENILKITWIDN